MSNIYFIGGPHKSHRSHLIWIESIGAKKIDFLSQKPKTKISFLRPLDVIIYQYSLYKKTKFFYEKKSIFILETPFSLPYAFFLKKELDAKIISIIPDHSFYPTNICFRKYFYEAFNLNDTVDYFIAVSEIIKKWMVDYGIDKDRIFVVRPVSTLKVSKEEIKNKKIKKSITFIKNYPSSKVAEIVLKIAKELSDFEFNIIGTVSKKIKNPPKNVKCYMNISWEDLKKILLSSSIYLHPMFFDPFAVSVLDAMRCGNFPLVYRLVGSSEILNEENIFYSLDEKEIAEKVLKTYENLSEKDFIKYYKLGMKFSEKESSREFRKVFNRILKESH